MRVGKKEYEGDLSMDINDVVWPGGTSLTPTDEGKPGKPVFRIGFIAPGSDSPEVLASYGQELMSAFKIAVEMINKDPKYKIELDGLITEEVCIFFLSLMNYP